MRHWRGSNRIRHKTHIQQDTERCPFKAVLVAGERQVMIGTLRLEIPSHSSALLVRFTSQLLFRVVVAAAQVLSGGRKMNKVLQTLRSDQQGQDIAEYAVMLAVILAIVVGTIRLVGSNANKVFSSVASSVQ